MVKVALALIWASLSTQVLAVDEETSKIIAVQQAIIQQLRADVEKIRKPSFTREWVGQTPRTINLGSELDLLMSQHGEGIYSCLLSLSTDDWWTAISFDLSLRKSHTKSIFNQRKLAPEQGTSCGGSELDLIEQDLASVKFFGGTCIQSLKLRCRSYS